MGLEHQYDDKSNQVKRKLKRMKNTEAYNRKKAKRQKANEEGEENDPVADQGTKNISPPKSASKPLKKRDQKALSKVSLKGAKAEAANSAAPENGKKFKKRVKISDNLKSLHIQLLLKKAPIAPSLEKKQEMVQQCLAEMKDEIGTFCRTRDGARLCRVMVRYGSAKQRAVVIRAVRPQITEFLKEKKQFLFLKTVFKYA